MEIINYNTITETSKIHRIILTSGKLYYELKRFREENKIENAAIIRIEQFYPYEKEMIENAIHSYPNAKKIIWVQEEPGNMGAWGFLYPRLIKSIDKRQDLSYSGRPESASPAVGSAKISTIQEKELLVEAFKE
jgi:2-oxoglutarate dehydrogenase E1 component